MLQSGNRELQSGLHEAEYSEKGKEARIDVKSHLSAKTLYSSLLLAQHSIFQKFAYSLGL